MRLSVEHCFYVPSKMASPEALQELLVQATLFPDTEIPRHSIEEIIEITKEKKHGNVDRIKLALQINGIYLEIPYWIGQSNLRNPADFQVLFIRYVWDGLHKNYPGEDKRLQDVLFWVFKYTDALYMDSWGQNDEFSQDVPDE